MIANAQPEAIVPVSNLDLAVAFYCDTLGLELVQRWDQPQNAMARLRVGNGIVSVYESVGAGQSRHTVAGFQVDGIDAAVDDLRGRCISFEEYDMGDIKTVNGIARIGDISGAWFKDPDGNILSIGSYGNAT